MFIGYVFARTYVCPLAFLITFETAFLSSFIPENSLDFTRPILSLTLKFDLNFLMIFESFLQASHVVALHPDAGPAELKVELPPITTAAFRGQSLYVRQGF